MLAEICLAILGYKTTSNGQAKVRRDRPVSVIAFEEHGQYGHRRSFIALRKQV